MDDSEVDFADYFPSSKRDPDEMWAELRGHRGRLRQPAPEGAARSHAGRPGHRRALPPRPRRQADSSRLPGRADRARAFALQPGQPDGPALPERRPATCCSPASSCTTSARSTSSTTSAASPTPTTANCWATSSSRCGWWAISCAHLPDFPPRLRVAGGAHDPEPPRPARVRLSQAAAVSRSRCCCTTWTTWIPRWSACAR